MTATVAGRTASAPLGQDLPRTGKAEQRTATDDY